MDPAYRASVTAPGEAGRAWFATEQDRVHAQVNRVWPRRLGTTPMGMARALSAHGGALGVRYGWRLFRGRRDRLTDVLREVDGGRPVAMLVGRFIPRHWVLLIGLQGHTLQCYEPSSGQVRSADVDTLREARLTGLGYRRPFAFVLPCR
jgi:hypothetical protein